MSSIPSAGRSLSLSLSLLSFSLALGRELPTFCCRTAHWADYMSSTGHSRVAAISDCGRAKGFPGALAALMLHFDGARIPKAVAQSHVFSQLRRRPFAFCVVGREKAARSPLAEGYPRTEAKSDVPRHVH